LNTSGFRLVYPLDYSLAAMVGEEFNKSNMKSKLQNHKIIKTFYVQRHQTN
jgi:hypothetical protein